MIHFVPWFALALAYFVGVWLLIRHIDRRVRGSRRPGYIEDHLRRARKHQ